MEWHTLVNNFYILFTKPFKTIILLIYPLSSFFLFFGDRVSPCSLARFLCFCWVHYHSWFLSFFQTDHYAVREKWETVKDTTNEGKCEDQTTLWSCFSSYLGSRDRSQVISLLNMDFTAKLSHWLYLHLPSHSALGGLGSLSNPKALCLLYQNYIPIC